ncbi:head-tail adaptor protein [Xylophilus sp. Leaf220]|uniref:head-tail adaptor protein n=1 Tax=Xylophilus sp. Leaf220 TaxID=1735686 RepID=UPI0006F4096F|nr:head-tail adaptor protein [Xylophilus sp. Leaf220]KQM78909.1 hypothetical protein ASE76_16090 [Xylophilus sp. Leaf220]
MRLAGKRDQRILIEALQVDKGTSGGMQQTWVPVARVWGSVRHLSGNEKRATAVGGLVAEARTEFEILYRPGVIATCDSGVNHG